MKVNEAPEKIYMTPSFGEPDNVLLASFSKSHLDFHRDVEYIRTDVFIEKAAVWFANRYQVNGSYLCADDIDDFEKYMKAGIKNDKIIVFESGLKEQK